MDYLWWELFCGPRWHLLHLGWRWHQQSLVHSWRGWRQWFDRTCLENYLCCTCLIWGITDKWWGFKWCPPWGWGAALTGGEWGHGPAASVCIHPSNFSGVAQPSWKQVFLLQNSCWLEDEGLSSASSGLVCWMAGGWGETCWLAGGLSGWAL